MFDENLSFDPMHELIKNRNKKLFILISLLVILLAVLRVVFTRFYVDPDIHYYPTDSDFIIRMFDYVSAAGIALLYVVSFFIYKYKKDEHDYLATAESFVQGTQTLVFSASVAGFLIVASAGWQVWTGLNSGFIPAGEVFTDNLRDNIFDILIFIAAVLSSVYFFKTALLNQDTGKPDEYSQFHIFMSFMPIIWSFLNTFKYFFEMSKSVNSPVKIYELMCLLALGVYFVSESRMIIGRRGISRFFTFAYIAVILVALSALPNLILSSFWIMQINSPQILYAVQFSFGLYILARAYSQIRYGMFMTEIKN